jgi:tetratricopeptide (TPR) repeat protein
MIITSVGSHDRQHPFLWSILLVLLINLTSLAQSDPNVKVDSGTGGRNTLQGDVYLPSGQRLDRPTLVKLNTVRGDITTTTNGNGSFTFRQLGGGRYTVRIDAVDSYAPASEVIEINESGFGGGMSRLGQTYTVQIRLQLLGRAPLASGVVSVDLPPKTAVDLFEKALASAKTGNRERAVEELKKAIAIHPTFVAALNGLGVQYIKLGEFGKAFEALSLALKVSPDNPMLHLNAGIALLRLKRFAEAEVELHKPMHGNEASGSAHLYRARALIGMGRLDEAEKDLNQAVAIGGDEVVIARRYLGGIYMQKGENAKAIRVLEQYLKSVSESQDTIQIRLLISQLQGKEKKH